MANNARRAGTLAPELLEILRWTASIGAITADALAHRLDVGLASAHGRLNGAARKRVLERHRLLAHAPALYTVTPAGLRAAGIAGFGSCRVSPGNAHHTMLCAHAAAVLQRRYPDQRVVGEHELRWEERRSAAALASAVMRSRGPGASVLHRPDLVMWPACAKSGQPLAVEIELTVKAPRRLEDICRAWARSRDVSGVVYFAPSDVERAVSRAIDRARAAQRIVVLPLTSLPLVVASPAPIERNIPSPA